MFVKLIKNGNSYLDLIITKATNTVKEELLEKRITNSQNPLNINFLTTIHRRNQRDLK